MKAKRYLGDGVYVAMERGMVKLTVNDGLSDTSTIYMEPETVAAFLAWLKPAEVAPELPKLFVVEVVRDPSSKEEEAWRVTVNGLMSTPSFNSRGAAKAYADAVASGKRKPELPHTYQAPIPVEGTGHTIVPADRPD